ncbi:MAG: pantoate kinase [Methanobacteriaceae archaeon]|nr:pantoate kinase [Methanobacteriaceae archaeon]
MKLESKVFVPSHITGFFEIKDNTNLNIKGSCGAGITLDKGIITHTKLTNGNGKIKITVNNKNTGYDISITKETIKIIKKECHVSLDDYNITINHDLDLPIGAGLGTSAGFALGTSLTLPKLLGCNLTLKQSGDIAHFAELSKSSGLGDVISELYGGCVLRLKSGSPSYGVIDKIPLDKKLYVFIKSFDSLETSKIITDPIYKQKINASANKLLDLLQKNPTLENFMGLSNKFANDTNLIQDDIKETIDLLTNNQYMASMAMLGNTVFTLSESPEVDLEDVIVTKINNSGVKYILN